jgi:hypothetical protein
VIFTRTSVISERKVWFLYERMWFRHAVLFIYVVCDFLYAECNFHTQCEFEYECDYSTHVWFQHAQECDFHTHASVILTRMRVNMALTSMITTRPSVIHTQRVQFLHAVWFLQALMWLRTSVVSTRTRLISTSRIWFPHAECDFTRSVVSSNFDTYECDYDTQEYDYDTQECDLYTHELNFNTMLVTVWFKGEID